jgi:hypothetical protein
MLRLSLVRHGRYSRKLGDQTGQNTTVPNAKDTCGLDEATQNIAY